MNYTVIRFRRAYYGQLESKQQKKATSLRPTILNRGVSAEKNQRESPTEAWQLQLYNSKYLHGRCGRIQEYLLITL